MSYYTGKLETSGNLAAHMQRKLDRVFQVPSLSTTYKFMTLAIISHKVDIFLIINNKRQISIKNGRERLYYLSILSVKYITKLLS